MHDLINTMISLEATPFESMALGTRQTTRERVLLVLEVLVVS